MFLKTVSVMHFRNLRARTLDLSPGANIFIGPNGSGKTSFLEAVHVLATARSHRAPQDSDLVQWGTPGFAVSGVARSGRGESRLDVSLAAGEPKKIAVDGKPLRRASELLSRLPLVSFSPEDLEVVKGAPEFRRRLLDRTLAAISPAYAGYWREYFRILAQRNWALKEAAGKARAGPLIEVWDERLAAAGVELVARRRDAVANLSTGSQGFYTMLGGGELALSYQCSFQLPRDPGRAATAGAFLDALGRLHGEELRRGHTLAGPHRDDVLVAIGGRDARQFASQGQQRVAALSMKLGQLEIISGALDEKAVLLLDDVTSELDPARRGRLAELVRALAVQCLVSVTDLADSRFSALPADALFAVDAGCIEEERR